MALYSIGNHEFDYNFNYFNISIFCNYSFQNFVKVLYITHVVNYVTLSVDISIYIRFISAPFWTCEWVGMYVDAWVDRNLKY